jgi:hypothetical protein
MPLQPPLADIDILNLALLQLGQAPVDSFDDKNDRAAVAGSRLYPFCRQTLLRNHTWNFARKRVELTATTETPPFDYTNVYNMPNDCIKIHHIGEEWDLRCPIPYDIQGRKLLVNQADFTTTTSPAALKLEYTQDVTDPNQFDALFREVFVLYLASYLALPVSGDMKLAAMLNTMYKQRLAEAVAINHQERMTRVIEKDPVYMARQIDYDEWDGQVNVPTSSWPA